MYCGALLCVHSSFAIILMGSRELVALLYLSSMCLVIVVQLLLQMPRVCLQFVIVVFPDHTHPLFWPHLHSCQQNIESFMQTGENERHENEQHTTIRTVYIYCKM